MANPIMTVLVLAGLLLQPARAELCAREESAEGRRLLVLENDQVRLAVAPDPGGTVVSFIDRKSGTEYVAGGSNVLSGKLGWGWKDNYSLEALDQLGRNVHSLPYKGEFRSGAGYKAIYVSVDTEGQRFEREMRLTDAGAELTTLSKITNIGDQPRRLQVRWHTYSQLDDLLASNSCIIAPGPGGEARKLFIGSGWDHQMITSDGYWLAANYKSGQGLWMTFKKEQSVLQMTWTDYSQKSTKPTRGAFIAEPYPQPVLAQPGESVQLESTFFPFTVGDAPDAFPLGVLSDPAEKERARQFLAQVKPNLAAIGPYTMTPGDPPGGLNAKPGENRFDFTHRRRDRFALRSWGLLDAMMAVPGVQEQGLRCRYYARLFDERQKPLKVSFRLRMLEPSGKVIREQTKDYMIDPARSRELDVRDDVPLTGLADGWHRFTLEGFVEGEKDPIHTYAENRRLVGQARAAYEQGLAEREKAPLVERPFVTALRRVTLPASEQGKVVVPIGVEEGGGIARRGWPVRCGVPFVQGLVAKESAFEVTGPDGKTVPVQVASMSTWLDGSLKWLLVEFPADVPANGHVFYTLKSAANPAAALPPLVATQGGNFSVNGAVYGAADEKLFGRLGPEDLWWEDGTGQRYFFRLTGEGAGLTLVENGPLRAVLKAAGWYVNGAGRAVCMGEVRMETYRGQPFTKLYHTVTFAGDPWKETLGSYGIRLHGPTNGFETATVELDGKAVTGRKIALFQSSSDSVGLTVDGKESAGRRSSGAAVLKGKSAAPIAFYHRDFWQMAPKKVEADAAAGTATFSYWPAEAGAMSFLPREDGWIPSSSSAEAIAVGLSRTHEIIIDAGSGTAVTAYERTFGEPVVAIVPPKYLAATKAMLHLAPYDPEGVPVLERVISDTIDFYQSQRELFGWYGEWVHGGIPNRWRPEEYRWADFGRYAWILNEEDIADGPWLCYLRSGDRKYLKFAESNTRHLMEVGTIRWNPTWPQYVGLSRRHHECLWLSGGDYGHSMLDPFVDYYHATGYRPAWEAAERMAGAMAKVTSGEWRYISNPTAGLARMYLETQNPFYKEHADRIWNTLCYPEKNDWWLIDHGDRMVMWYSQLNPQCKELWKDWSLNPKKTGRFAAQPRFAGADVLAALYLETGDPKYAEAVRKAVPAARPVNLTQHVLAGLRAWCYAGGALDGK
jgi:hypothetical protein